MKALFMGGDTHEMSIATVELDDLQNSNGCVRYVCVAREKIKWARPDDVLSTPLFEDCEENELVGRYGSLRILSDEEFSTLMQADIEARAKEMRRREEAKQPQRGYPVGGCYSCGGPAFSGRECPRCGADRI